MDVKKYSQENVDLIVRKALERYRELSGKSRGPKSRKKSHKRKYSSSTTIASESSTESSVTEIPDEQSSLQKNAHLNQAKLSAPELQISNSAQQNPEYPPPTVKLSPVEPTSSDKPALPSEFKKWSQLQIMTQVQSQVCSAITANNTALGSLMKITKGPLSVMHFISDAKGQINDALKQLVDLQETLIRLRQVYDIQNIEKTSPEMDVTETSVKDNPIDFSSEEDISENEKVLKYLKAVSPHNFQLPRFELARKLAFLLHHESRRSVETVAKIKLSNVAILDDHINVKVPEDDLNLQINENKSNPELCVIAVLKAYLDHTKRGRGSEEYLFLKNKRRGNCYPPARAKLIAMWIHQLKIESRVWKERDFSDKK